MIAVAQQLEVSRHPLPKRSPSEARIMSISLQSPLQLLIWLAPGVTLLILKLVSKVIEVYSQCLDAQQKKLAIQKAQLELKLQKLDTAQLVSVFETIHAHTQSVCESDAFLDYTLFCGDRKVEIKVRPKELHDQQSPSIADTSSPGRP